jgi:hypothetical protein
MPAQNAHSWWCEHISRPKTMELILCVTFSSRGCSSLASLRSRSRIRQLSRAITRVRRLSRRPPGYRIGSACNQGNGAILATVNSQPTSSVRRPHLVQAPTVARIPNTFFRNSSEVTGHTVRDTMAHDSADRRRREASKSALSFHPETVGADAAISAYRADDPAAGIRVFGVELRHDAGP